MFNNLISRLLFFSRTKCKSINFVPTSWPKSDNLEQNECVNYESKCHPKYVYKNLVCNSLTVCALPWQYCTNSENISAKQFILISPLPLLIDLSKILVFCLIFDICIVFIINLIYFTSTIRNKLKQIFVITRFGLYYGITRWSLPT